MARKDGKPRGLPQGFQPLTRSGFCAFPTTGQDNHNCHVKRCDCDCHKEATS
jgi:hypothetical protein